MLLDWLRPGIRRTCGNQLLPGKEQKLAMMLA
jgi:hypothetical protein